MTLWEVLGTVVMTVWYEGLASVTLPVEEFVVT